MSITARQDVIASIRRSARNAIEVATDEQDESPEAAAHLIEVADQFRLAAHLLEEQPE